MPLLPPPPGLQQLLASLPDTVLDWHSFRKPFLEPAFRTVLRSKGNTFPLFRFCLCFGGFALKSCHPSNLVLLIKNFFLYFHIKCLLTKQEAYKGNSPVWKLVPSIVWEPFQV